MKARIKYRMERLTIQAFVLGMMLFSVESFRHHRISRPTGRSSLPILAKHKSTNFYPGSCRKHDTSHTGCMLRSKLMEYFACNSDLYSALILLSRSGGGAQCLAHVSKTVVKRGEKYKISEGMQASAQINTLREVDESVKMLRESNNATFRASKPDQSIGFFAKLGLRQLETGTSNPGSNSIDQRKKSFEKYPNESCTTMLHLITTYSSIPDRFKVELRLRGGSCYCDGEIQRNSSYINDSQMICNYRWLSYTNWATIEQLTSKQVAPTLSNQELTNISDQIVYFKRLWLNYASHPVVENRSADLNLSRHFSEDIFWKMTGFAQQVSHLVPHSASSNRFWNPLLYFFTGRPGLHYLNASFAQQMEFHRFVNGFSQNQEIWSKFPYSSLLDATSNHILMRFADRTDDEEALLMVPLMPIDKLLAWDGEGYEFLCIPKNAVIFEVVGACLSPRNMSPYAHSVSSKEKRVEEGFNSLGIVFSLLVYLMKDSVSELTDSEQRLSKRNFACFLNFTKNAVLFPVPTLPAEEIMFRFSSFGKVGCAQPGKFGHPAPHPLLLLCRTLNAWLAFLFEQRDRGNHHFEYLKDMVVPAGSTGCVLLPSCADIPGLSSCALCLSRAFYDRFNIWDILDGWHQVEAVLRLYSCEGSGDDLAVLRGICASVVEKAIFEDTYSEESFDYYTVSD
jgi:hypothetical protein